MDSLLIAAFNTVDGARHAVDQMAATGIPKNDIALVASDDELCSVSEHELARECAIVHTSTYEEFAAAGGALGAALGMFAGSIIALRYGAEGWPFALSLLIAAGSGLVLGGLATWTLPHLHSKAVRQLFSRIDRLGYGYSSQRLIQAGAYGGFYGALIGCSSCYGITVGTVYYLWVLGLIAAVIIGGLVGSLKGYVLEPHIPAHERDLGDPIHRVLVSVDCKACTGKIQSEIQTLLSCPDEHWVHA